MDGGNHITRDFLLRSTLESEFIRRRAQIDLLTDDICQRYGFERSELYGECRESLLVVARQELYARGLAICSLSELSRILLKDRSTIRNGSEAHRRRVLKGHKALNQSTVA